MIAEGRWGARAKTWDFGITDNGNEQFAIEFELLDGPSKGQSITWYGYFSKGVSKKDGKPYDLAETTIKTLRYCGWTGDDLTDVIDLDKNEVQLVIEHEQYNGKTSAKVRFVNRQGGLAIKNKLPETAKNALAKKYKGLAMSIPKSLAESRSIEDSSFNTDDL